MTPYRLDQVVGALLIALAEAQHLSDEYTDWLRGRYSDPGNKLSVLQVPNAQLQQATVNLQMAVAAVGTEPKAGETPPAQADTGKPREQLWVYVDASDLATLPPNTVSTLTLNVQVRDADIVELPQQTPVAAPRESGRGER